MSGKYLFSWAPKSLWTVTAAMKLKDACSWKKSYDQPRQHIKKQRHHFANKGPSSQSYGFSSSHLWMWELDHKEGWVLKDWFFRSAVLEKTLESPWTARRFNQLILKEISPEYSLEGLMLKLQYFGYLMWRADSLEKTLMLGQTEGRKGDNGERDGWMASLTRWTWVWASSGRWWRTGEPGMLQSMGSQRARHNWVTEQQKYSSKEDISSTTTEVRVGIRNEIWCQAPYQFLKLLKQ